MGVVELFPVRVRAQAMGISYNCGMTLFGGLLPAVSQASLEVSPLGPGMILSVCGFLTAASIVVSLIYRGGSGLTHIRHTPYFGSGLLCSSLTDEQRILRIDGDAYNQLNGSGPDVTELACSSGSRET